MKALFFGILFCSIVHVYSQHVFQVRADDVPLTEILKELEEQYALKFSYNSKRLESIRVVADLTTNDPTLLLDELFKYTPYSYSEVKGVFLIIPDRNKKIILPKLSGRVYDARTGAPLAFAHVKAKYTGGITDLNGVFLLDNSKKTDSIEVSFVGYEPKIIGITDTTQRGIKINLQPDTSLLPEFIVNANTQLTEVTEVSDFHINTTQISALPSLGQPDIFKSLQLIPGVSATDETQSGLSIRGTGSEQNLVLMDGFTIYHMDHLFGLYSTFNPFTINQVQIYKGGFSSRYGGRISSVVDSRMRAPNTASLRGAVHINPMAYNIYLESPLGEKWSFITSYRSSFAGFFESAVYGEFIQRSRVNILESILITDEEPAVLEPTFFFYDFNSKIRFRPTEKDFFDLNIFLSQDEYDGVFEETYDDSYVQILDNARWGNLGASLNWNRFITDDVSHDVNLSLSTYNSVSQSGIEETFRLVETSDGNEVISKDTTITFNDVDKSNELTDLSLKWNHLRVLPSMNRLELGTEINLIGTEYFISFEGEENQAIASANLLTSGYVQYEINEGKWNINAGLRGSYYTNTDEYYLEPRIRMSYELTKHVKLKGAFSTHNQFINRVSFSPFGNSDQFYWVIADDETYPIMSSQQLIGGISFQKDKWSLDLEAYSKASQGVLESEFVIFSLFESEQFEEPVDFFLSGKNFAQGIDFYVKRRDDHYTTWLSYSLAESMNEFDIINAGAPYPSFLDQRHEVNWVQQWKWKNWGFGSTFVFGSGKPYTPALEDAAETFQIYDLQNINQKRLPVYHRLDISAKYNWNWIKSDWSLGLSVFNLYNRQNVKSRRFTLLFEEENDQPFLDTRILPVDINLLGFAPNLFLEVVF